MLAGKIGPLLGPRTHDGGAATTDAACVALRMHGWERFSSASGILFVVLLYTGAILADTTVLKEMPEPSRDASGTQLANYFAASRFALLVGGYIGSMAAVCLVFFVASLWRLLRAAEGSPGVISGIAFGAGIVTAGLLLAGGGPGAAALQPARPIDPVEALTLRHISFGLLQRSWFTSGALLGASALVGLRTGALPRWLAWLGAVTASALFAVPLVLAAAPIWGGWVFVQALFLLWIAVASVVLVRRPSATR